jgi:hypothetical protein
MLDCAASAPTPWLRIPVAVIMALGTGETQPSEIGIAASSIVGDDTGSEFDAFGSIAGCPDAFLTRRGAGAPGAVASEAWV